MSAVAARAIVFEEVPRSMSGSDGTTLDDLVTAAWRGLAMTRQAPCLICGGTLRADEHGGADGRGRRTATCSDCGAELS